MTGRAEVIEFAFLAFEGDLLANSILIASQARELREFGPDAVESII
jgi:hypothetical protein